MTRTDGTSIINFLSTKFLSRIYYSVPEKIMIVKERHISHPDIISLEATGDKNNWELIYKYNQVSNPFSVNVGEVLYIPNIQDTKNSLVHLNLNQKITLLEDNDFRKPLIEKNNGRLEYEEKLKTFNKNFNFSKYNLPPNVAEPGDKEVTVDKDGKVILGNDIIKKRN